MSARTPTPVWLVLADPLSARVFMDCGIAERLSAAYASRLQTVFLFRREETERWAARVTGRAVLFPEDVAPPAVSLLEGIIRRGDLWLDRQIGYFPLAIRLNYRHGFHLHRMRAGHANWLLDSDRIGSLPRWHALERAMQRWHFSPRRYVPHVLLERLRAERPAIVFSNLQMQAAVPFIVAARRLGLTLIGYVASWDHTVGKGVISPHLDRYIVQNDVMHTDLIRYHNIDPQRIVVTGWPQTDVFHVRRPRSRYDLLVRAHGLDPARPVVLVMGNTPTNAPYERGSSSGSLASGSAVARRAAALFRPASARPRVAVESLASSSRQAGGGGAGAELLRTSRPSPRAQARRLRRRQRRHDPA